MYRELAQTTKAMRMLEQALILSRETNDKGRQALYVNALGVCYASVNNHEKAREFYDRSLKIAKLVNNVRLQACVTHNIGNSYRLSGDYTKSISYFEEALQLARSVNDHIAEAECMRNLALVYSVQPEGKNKAKELLQSALTLSNNSGRLGLQIQSLR